MRFRRQARVAVALGAVLVVGNVAPAGAATQIGETFPVMGGCSAGFTWLASASPNGQHAAPFDGVITSWSFHAGATAPQLKFKVARPVTPTSYTIVGDTGVRSTVANVLNTFPAQIPVLAGDVIGFFTVMGSHPCLRPNTGHNYVVSSGDVPPGATATFGGEIHQQLDISAMLERDCDGDGLGDETQDASADCIAPDATITKHPKNKTRKRRATFEFSSSEPGSSFECSLDGAPFAACTSPLTAKVKRGKHTFSVRAKDPAGNVDPTSATDDWKVKKKKKK
jgi:hypothetical protein